MIKEIWKIFARYIVGFILAILSLVVWYYSMGAIIEKYGEVMVARVSIKNPPYTIGSNCLMGGESVAILKKYLDSNNQWLYDVMVLDSEGTKIPVRMRVSHKSIGYCVE